jgi:hypothetical protein
MRMSMKERVINMQLEISTEGFIALQEKQLEVRSWLAAHQRYSPATRAWFKKLEIERDRNFHITHNQD